MNEENTDKQSENPKWKIAEFPKADSELLLTLLSITKTDKYKKLDDKRFFTEKELLVIEEKYGKREQDGCPSSGMLQEEVIKELRDHGKPWTWATISDYIKKGLLNKAMSFYKDEKLVISNKGRAVYRADIIRRLNLIKYAISDGQVYKSLTDKLDPTKEKYSGYRHIFDYLEPGYNPETTIKNVRKELMRIENAVLRAFDDRPDDRDKLIGGLEKVSEKAEELLHVWNHFREIANSVDVNIKYALDRKIINSKRKLIYIPKLYPGTFVFFYQKGNNQTSFSIRDYSKTPVDERRGKTHFHGTTAEQILQEAEAVETAPTHPTKDELFWKKKISEANIRHEKNTGEIMKFKIGEGLNSIDTAQTNETLPDDLKGKYEHWMATAPSRGKAGKPYFVGHDGVPSTGGFTNRVEEHLAMALFNRYRPGGEVIELDGVYMSLLDYQFPLKAARSDKIGKIDLIGLDSEGRVCVIELKAWNNASDTPEKALWQALGYTAAVEANIGDIRREKTEILHDKPTIYVMAPSKYWEIHVGEALFELAKSIERELSIPVRFVKINVDKDALLMGLNNTKPQIDGAISFETA